MLNKKQFTQLRKEICLNSLFLNDYQNTLGIAPTSVYSFFDSYLDYKMIIFEENNPAASSKEKDEYFYKVLEKNDIKEMYEYYIYLEYDALPIKEK